MNNIFMHFMPRALLSLMAIVFLFTTSLLANDVETGLKRIDLKDPRVKCFRSLAQLRRVASGQAIERVTIEREIQRLVGADISPVTEWFIAFPKAPERLGRLEDELAAQYPHYENLKNPGLNLRRFESMDSEGRPHGVMRLLAFSKEIQIEALARIVQFITAESADADIYYLARVKIPVFKRQVPEGVIGVTRKQLFENEKVRLDRMRFYLKVPSYKSESQYNGLRDRLRKSCDLFAFVENDRELGGYQIWISPKRPEQALHLLEAIDLQAEPIDLYYRDASNLPNLWAAD